MSTSGTYSFNPSAADIILEAFSRIELRGTAITQQHMFDARMSANLMNQAWLNRGVNLWTVTQASMVLSQGTPTYSLTPTQPVANLLDCYYETSQTSGTVTTVTDTYIYQMSRTEYASIANKTTQGPPTALWFNRQIVPTVTFYPVPDGNGPYTFFYWYQGQIQDTTPTMDLTLGAPQRFYDAYAAELAKRLSVKWKPDKYQLLALEAKTAWEEAATDDTENVPLYIVPGLAGYYRRMG